MMLLITMLMLNNSKWCVTTLNNLFFIICVLPVITDNGLATYCFKNHSLNQKSNLNFNVNMGEIRTSRTFCCYKTPSPHSVRCAWKLNHFRASIRNVEMVHKIWENLSFLCSVLHMWMWNWKDKKLGSHEYGCNIEREVRRKQNSVGEPECNRRSTNSGRYLQNLTPKNKLLKALQIHPQTK